MPCSTKKVCEINLVKCAVGGPYYIWTRVWNCGPGETVIIDSPRCAKSCLSV